VKLFCIIGLPGAGKTTATAGAIELLGWQETEVRETPVPHVRYGRTAVQLGRLRNEFGGTDALAMNVSPKARAFIVTRPAPLVVAEGDRLAHASFLDAAASVGRVELVFLDLPPMMARERGVARAEALRRKPQTASWFKGRATKIDNLIAAYPHVRINAARPAALVASEVASHLRAEYQEEATGK
jgi:P-loop Nucleotide Kinase3